MEFDNGPFIFRINENGGGPTLLAQVCCERGWREYSTDPGSPLREQWNLWWRGSGFAVNHYKLLKSWQFTNHMPKGASICRKDSLARYLRCMQKIYGTIYDFSPPGFNLPLEYTKLVAECSRQRQHDEDKVWICKPVSQSQGRGIFLFRRLSELSYDNSAVVQRYIENPLLIGGYKFDLRLYVCIPSYHPLVVYLYSEGLARFGTDKFTLSDLDNRFRHLTNSSLNKLGPGYAENKDRVGAGCKWTLKQLRHYFQQVGINDWLLWQRISSLVVLTVLSQLQGIPETANCFEFYGFDVLVDSDLRPWLLEVNLSPALGNDCDVDAAVKKPLLHDMFDLLGLPVCNTGLSLFTVWSPPAQDKPIVAAAASRWRRNQRVRKKSASRTNATSKQDDVTQAANKVIVKLSEANQAVKPKDVNEGTKPRTAGKLRTNKSDGKDRNSSSKRSGESRESVLSHVNLNQQANAGETWVRYNPAVVDRSKGMSRGLRAARREVGPPAWGNDRDWSDPARREGGWVRICPLGGAASTSPVALADEASLDGTMGDRAVKVVVAAVHKYVKTARDIAKKCPDLTDEACSELLQHTLKLKADIWMPQK